MTEVQTVLGRRAEMKHAPASLTVSDSVALGIANIFSSASQTGQVFERFVRTGSVDSRELLGAAEFEQGYASAEGHAALYCLIGWVHAKLHGRDRAAETDPAEKLLG
jgi:hypothetical protein